MIEKVKTDKKKLLIYAHYYIPDVASTGQILRELAEGMIDEFDITIVCVVPSYTGKVAAEYKKNMFYKEEINGVKVVRIRVPEFSKSNKLSRVKNILSYFIGAMIATFKVGKMDYVYSISQPPILGGLLGVWGKWMKRAKYIYNIQDFNPEQTMAVGYSKNKLILKVMMWFDKFSCKQANKVIVVGRDMLETLKGRFKERKVLNQTFINNWIDEKEIYPLKAEEERVVEFKRKYGLEDKYVIMYSGNLGLYYDLENLIRVIKRFPSGTETIDGKRVVFVFVGEGSVRDKLVFYKEKNELDNVIFIPYQDKSDLVYSLNACDVQMCISAAGIKGVSVPSKIYGIMAAGKPVLGVLEHGAEARLIIEETGCGLVCEPSDYEAIEENINKFIRMDSIKGTQMGMAGRTYLVEKLTKDVSIKKYITEINSC
ncbi:MULTISPECIES: glycosyltransferase family 4 protein [Priestia]|uniref:glycosyltransferase family 4 protein n=1 Tax=Priestia TaxID=2800373 RepID=UPI0024051EEC|nr:MULTISPECIES: glycosyltransferase family 4 protein [Priestia]MDG0060840.1 glycosyltransferase family 4 protein [Priestia sp. P5]WDC89508.1 glycosyltransferase family 4 protein [Priestia megaterium]